MALVRKFSPLVEREDVSGINPLKRARRYSPRCLRWTQYPEPYRAGARRERLYDAGTDIDRLRRCIGRDWLYWTLNNHSKSLVKLETARVAG